MEIIGVGFDDPDENAAWAEDEGFPYELWTDDDRTLAVTYGAGSTSSSFPSRVTMVLDEQCTLVLEYTDNVAVGAHPAQVLDDLEQLFGG